MRFTRISLLLTALIGLVSETDHVTAQTSPPAPNIVLLPAPVGVTQGAYGSQWETELWIHNSQGQAVIVTWGVCILDGSEQCFVSIPPGETVIFPAQEGRTYETITVGSNLEALHFNLRTRDRSRAAQSAGTEIPVVRGEEFYYKPIWLLNVSIDPRFRNTLRIFLHPLDGSLTVTVRVHDASEGVLLAERVVTIQSPPFHPPFATGWGIGSAMLTDILTGLPPGVDRARIEIAPVGSSSGRFWAYVSTTNNETQQITTVTPQ